MKKMKNRWKQMIVWCMVAALLCVNCSFTSEAKTGSKVTVLKTSITAVRSRSAGQVTVTFKKAKKAGSCQIQISTDKKFKKNVKSQKVSAKKTTVTFKKLKQGKKYYVRVRVYRTVKKKKYHSAWSSVKSVKVKKKMTKKNDSQNNTDQNNSQNNADQNNAGDNSSHDNNTDVADTTEDTNTGGKQDTGSGTKDAQDEKGEWDGTAELEKMEYEVGEEIKVRYSKQPECAGEIKEYYTYGNRGEYIDYTEKYTKKNEDGSVVCTSIGYTRLCIIFPETEHYKETRIALGKVRIYNNEDPIGGFDLSGYTVGETMKTKAENTTVMNGTGSFCEWFTCEGNAAWLNEHITFKVSDVTPKEYRNLMDWAGWNTSEPEIKEETCCNLQGVYGEVTSVTTPVTSGKVAFSGKAMSQCKLTVTAGAGVRVCRLDAYRDGVLYDTMYVAAKPYDEAGNLLDTELYTKVRRNVEQKLWTDDMSNYDKLDALADYISTTAHYPKYKCTQKEVNPTLWDSFAVDDVALYYDMFNMPVLNRAMALRGGIITCVAVDIVCAAAEEDLGLKYLYDKATDTVAEGEGVWLAIGSASTNPGAGAHESLSYKNADGDIVYIDAQGMHANNSCEAHGCLNKVIRD
ncbi:MAG: hypothetical protein UE033_01155 [Coprococcus sp.]|nr:hypothetical protein [Coprococcus sp.]